MRHFSISDIPNVMRPFFPQCPLDYDRRKPSVKRSFFCVWVVLYFSLFFLPLLTLLCFSATSQSFHVFGSTTVRTGRILSNDRVTSVNFIFLSASWIFTNFRRFRKVTEEWKRNMYLHVARGKKKLKLPAITFLYLPEKEKIKRGKEENLKLGFWVCKIFHKLKKKLNAPSGSFLKLKIKYFSSISSWRCRSSFHTSSHVTLLNSFTIFKNFSSLLTLNAWPFFFFSPLPLNWASLNTCDTLVMMA